MFSFLHRFHHAAELAVDFGTAVLRTGDATGTRLPAVPSTAGPRPALRDGVVVDMVAAAEVLRGAFHGRHPRVLACAPSDATEGERLRLLASLRNAGAITAAVIPEPIAALVGAGADLSTGKPHLLVDFGEGVVDCAVVVERQLHASVALRGGCAALRNGLIAHLHNHGHAGISPNEAERLIQRIGLLPANAAYFPVAPALVHGFLQAETGAIIAVILRFLETLPPELCAEIISNGIILTGGGTLIPGLSDHFSEQTGVPFHRAPKPLDSVIDGACSILGPTVRLNLWDDVRNFWNTRPCPAGARRL